MNVTWKPLTKNRPTRERQEYDYVVASYSLAIYSAFKQHQPSLNY